MNIIKNANKNPVISFFAIFFMGAGALHQYYEYSGMETVKKDSFVKLVDIEDKYVHKKVMGLIVDENKVCKNDLLKSESHSQILNNDLNACKQLSKKYLDKLNSFTDNALNTDEFINHFHHIALPVLKARIKNILAKDSNSSLWENRGLHMQRAPVCHKVSSEIAQTTSPNHMYSNKEDALYYIDSMQALTSFYSGAMNYPNLPVEFRLLTRERSVSNLTALKNKYLFDLTKYAKNIRDDWSLSKLARPFIYYSRRINNTKEFESKLKSIQKIYSTRNITLTDFYNAGFPRNQNPCIADTGIEEGYYKFWFRRFDDGTYEQIKMIAEYLYILD